MGEPGIPNDTSGRIGSSVCMILPDTVDHRCITVVACAAIGHLLFANSKKGFQQSAIFVHRTCNQKLHCNSLNNILYCLSSEVKSNKYVEEVLRIVVHIKLKK